MELTPDEIARKRAQFRTVAIDEPTTDNSEALIDEVAVARAQKKRQPPPHEAPWMEQLLCGNSGPLKNIANVRRALQLAPEFKSALAWDMLAQNFVLLRETPAGGPGPGTDQTVRMIAAWLQEQGFNVGINIVADGILAEAGDNAFHPVQRYLNGLVWDGVPRINEWLPTYAGAVSNDYTRAVGSKWLIAAMARALKPGCKADTMLVLEGDQGRGKSTLFLILGGEWFSDQISAFGSKDSSMEATRWWIIEVAELNALNRSETSAIKAFMSRQSERFRLPYGRVVADIPRSCVLAGTVNPDGNGYLQDPTGARRFWPVETIGELQTKELARDRDQIWAEAVHRYKAREQWWLTHDEETIAQDEQDDRYASDCWEVPVSKWVTAQEAAGKEITMAGILSDCLLIEIGKQTEGHQRKVGKTMSKLGFKRMRRGPREDRVYYYQRSSIRKR